MFVCQNKIDISYYIGTYTQVLKAQYEFYNKNIN